MLSGMLPRAWLRKIYDEPLRTPYVCGTRMSDRSHGAARDDGEAPGQKHEGDRKPGEDTP